MTRTRRAVVLVDAEHQPSALTAALEALAEIGDEPVLTLFVGGSEKVDRPGEAPDLGYPTSWPSDPRAGLVRAIAEHDPDVVIDRTADPVVDDRRRNSFAAIALNQQVAFETAGAYYEPLDRSAPTGTTAVAVIATGKRTGKTALSGAFTRHGVQRGRTPCVLAMGRGGPAEPVVIEAASDLAVSRLIELARAGEHAASDFYEDAVMTGVATIGCRRVGEGPTGEVGYSNVPAGLVRLREMDIDLAVLEGSGAAIPPAHADASMLIVPATADVRDLYAMLPLRFLIADLVVITMADRRLVPDERIGDVRDAIHAIMTQLGRGDDLPPMVTTRFEPRPLQDVEGQRVFVATTAPPATGPALTEDLEAQGAEVVGISHELSNRPRLRDDLHGAPPHDLLVTELKAAGVDVAAAHAQDRGVGTVFYDNRPVDIGEGALADAFDRLLEVADARSG